MNRVIITQQCTNYNLQGPAYFGQAIHKFDIVPGHASAINVNDIGCQPVIKTDNLLSSPLHSGQFAPEGAHCQNLDQVLSGQRGPCHVADVNFSLDVEFQYFVLEPLALPATLLDLATVIVQL